ncbi:MaoC/PaaZ C-terminal domain-containing protein [Halosegnis marinus]|uniref:MaoC/PaaZ C-terminal domain-containing protein n=1 Tax=Halosegnis marinus TaxID=3034023 RepID=A0ABD5ZKN6_9EURY|nr:MaoC/PaaZ C-terminal domain-containing protein [Halosegnis sp. DT85]
MRTFDDLEPGWTETYGPHTMERTAMTEFAAGFDPQPMHLDAEAAREKGYEDVFASGLHTVGVGTRLLVENFLNDSTNLGGLGIEELSWHAPVYPGDELSVRHEVVSTRVSESNPDRGVVVRDIEVFRGEDGDEEVVCSWTVAILMARG